MRSTDGGVSRLPKLRTKRRAGRRPKLKKEPRALSKANVKPGARPRTQGHKLHFRKKSPKSPHGSPKFNRYVETSRSILRGCDDLTRTRSRPETDMEESNKKNLQFLDEIFKRQAKGPRITHAELRTRSIEEKKMKMKVKEQRLKAQRERERRSTLMQAELKVLQAQLEIDHYKANFRPHEVFVFQPQPLDAGHEHVRNLQKMWYDDVMAQMRHHRQTQSTFDRLWSVAHTPYNWPMETNTQSQPSSGLTVLDAQLVALIAQVRTSTVWDMDAHVIAVCCS